MNLKQGRMHGHQLRTGGQGGNAVFPLFNLIIKDQRTQGRTDGQTDKASYRVACPQKSKMVNFLDYLQLLKLMIRSKENGYQNTQMSC